MYWLAAHGINARKYQWQQAVADGVKPFTGHRLCVYLVKRGDKYNKKPEAQLVMQNYIPNKHIAMVLQILICY